MTVSFVHLNLHSEYSIVDSLIRIDELVKQAVSLKMPAVAITDEMNLFGLVKFYQAAINAGIKPIIGADLLLLDGNETYRVAALCKNSGGYRHLAELLSRAYLEGQKDGRVRIHWDWLVNAKDGLILLSGYSGDVGQALVQGNKKLAEERLNKWLSEFHGNFYLTLTRTQRPQEEGYLPLAMELAKHMDVPVVATNEVRFLNSDDFEAHEARVCIHQGYTLEDPNRPRPYNDQQYFKTSEAMAALFSDIPEALINSVEIAKRCNVQLQLGKVFLPKFPVPNDASIEEYFIEQAKRGLENRLSSVLAKSTYRREDYEARLEHEVSVINKMGFAGYFLIVADFIRWAKQEKIPVGPGRGSGAGSLVAFSLGITELDPLQHELLFERLLNPDRVSMPDFDVDFCMEGRDRVIDYVAERYGHQAVAQIITYGTMAAKAVVRDVGRVLGMPYGFVDKIAKLIPFELGITLQKALNQEEALSKRYEEESEVRNLLDLAMKLEGLTRNAGKHAGGVVIAPTRLTDFVPLYREPDGEHVVTQFDKDDVEAVGLVKFDFLGLRTLTIIDWAVQTINRKLQEKNQPLLDISDIPLDDEKTYQLLKRCATTAVFQLESRGMKDLVRRLQPDNFDDIKALVALFRPGPLQSGMVDTFIACKHGQQPVHYPHPELKPILQSTYGVILYQEQVMQIAQVLAGYSLGGADVLRSAMGKKKLQEMAKQREVFLQGAKARGIDPRLATQIFDLMEKFAGYGFNKSHSAAYALLSYQTAYLKAHYPAEFMAAVLSSDMDNTDKVVGFINECRDLNLKILPPDINRGDYHFTVNEAGEIEYGLGAIKGVGQAAIENLMMSRKTDGPFKSLFDLCHRTESQKINRRVLEALIRSGALDAWGVPRASLFQSLDKALQSAEQKNRNAELGQNDLFGLAIGEETRNTVTDYVLVSDWSDSERLRGEKETLGLYMSGHPLQACERELSGIVTSTINRLQVSAKNSIVVAGMMVSLRTIMTRTGKRMAVVVLEDRTGRIEITLFSNLYNQIIAELNDNSILVIRGTVAADDFTGGIKMVADTVLTLDQVRQQMARRLLIRVKDNSEVDRLLTELPEIIALHRGGRCPIAIAYSGETAGAELILGENWRVKPNSELLNQLNHLCGPDKVQLEY